MDKWLSRDDPEHGKTTRHAADVVFDAYAGRLLRGEFAYGAYLPSEGTLANEFGVSKLVARQALHRLASAELIVVHHGSSPRALDPWRSCSLAVIELAYRLAPELARRDEIVRSVLEKQYTQGLSIVEVFSRRASAADKQNLVKFVNGSSGAAKDGAALDELEKEFWTRASSVGGNRILAAEVRFWYQTLTERPRFAVTRSRADQYAFYVELARLMARGDAITFYVQTLAPAIEALEPTAKVDAKSAKKNGDPGKKKVPR